MLCSFDNKAFHNSVPPTELYMTVWCVYIATQAQTFWQNGTNELHIVLLTSDNTHSDIMLVHIPSVHTYLLVHFCAACTEQWNDVGVHKYNQKCVLVWSSLNSLL